MSLLLLFNQAAAAPPGADAAVVFTASGSFTATATAEHFAAVSFAATASLSPNARRTLFAAVPYTASGSLAAAGSRVVSWASVRFTARAIFDPVIRPRGKKRRVVVTDFDGTPYGELEKAKVGAIVKELNRPDEWSFATIITDPKADLVLAERIREAQLWRGDQLLSWGPMVRPAADKAHLAVSGKGALWHLTRRHIGKADRTNYVLNGDFEDGLAHWNVATNLLALHYDDEGAQATPPLNAIVDFPVVTGRRALRLENYTTGADAWAGQAFLWTVDEDLSPDGDLFTLKAYVYVPSANYVAPALDKRGLFLARNSTTELWDDPRVQAFSPGAKKPIEVSFVPIDENTPKDIWVPVELTLKTPPKAGEPEVIDLRLYAPNGVAVWDRVSLTLDESTVFFGVDQALIAQGIVEHLQDAAYDKNDVNIGTDCPLTGVLRDRRYRHAEHPNGFGALEDFTHLDNGFDVDMAYTPTQRIFRTFFPMKGIRRAKYALDLGKNIADFAWSFDGEAASSSVIVLGQGDGSGREEGFAIDPTAFAGGLTLEEVFSAPPETPIDSLDNLAVEKLTLSTSPEVLAVKTRPAAADLFAIITTGDTVPVRIRRGPLAIDEDYRVVRFALNPDDTIDWIVNRRVLA